VIDHQGQELRDAVGHLLLAQSGLRGDGGDAVLADHLHHLRTGNRRVRPGADPARDHAAEPLLLEGLRQAAHAARLVHQFAHLVIKRRVLRVLGRDAPDNLIE
jgi:hypothetical protein